MLRFQRINLVQSTRTVNVYEIYFYDVLDLSEWTETKTIDDGFSWAIVDEIKRPSFRQFEFNETIEIVKFIFIDALTQKYECGNIHNLNLILTIK